MTLNRLLTSIVQLMLIVPALYCARAIYYDIKENGFFPKEGE